MAGVDLTGSSDAAAMGSGSAFASTTAATTALTTVQGAITRLATDRAQIAANVARLKCTREQSGIRWDDLSRANSRIKKVDVVEGSTRFARYNSLVQAGAAMLPQLNQTPEGVLRPLQ
jgi:flagellin